MSERVTLANVRTEMQQSAANIRVELRQSITNVRQEDMETRALVNTIDQSLVTANFRISAVEQTVTAMGQQMLELAQMVRDHRAEARDTAGIAMRNNEQLEAPALQHRGGIPTPPGDQYVDQSRFAPNNSAESYENTGAAIRERRFRMVLVQADVLMNAVLRPQDQRRRFSCDAPPNCIVVSMQAHRHGVGVMEVLIAHHSFPSLMPNMEVPVHAFSYTAEEPDPPVPSANSPRPADRIISWRNVRNELRDQRGVLEALTPAQVSAIRSRTPV